MSAHDLLNCLNELSKRDKMLDKPRNEFNKFISTGAQLLDSIYDMTSKLDENNILGEKKRQDFVIFAQRYNGRHYVMLLNL